MIQWGAHEDYSYLEKCQSDRLNWIVGHVNECNPDRVLEVGCAEGLILSKCNGNYKVGIDIDENRLIACKVKHPELMLYRVDASFGLPFPDNNMTVGIAAEVHEHLPKHRSEYLAQEMRRVCYHVVVTIPMNQYAHGTDEHLWVIEELHLQSMYPGIHLERYSGGAPQDLFMFGVWHR